MITEASTTIIFAPVRSAAPEDRQAALKESKRKDGGGMNERSSLEVLCFGEPLVGLYAPQGKSYAEDVCLSVVWGGDTSNVATAVSRLGHGSSYLSSISQGIRRSALEVSFALMECARSENISISYDVNYRPALWTPELARAVIRQSIEEYADIVMISGEEMGLLNWGESVADLQGQLRRMPRLCALKHGPRGCTVIREGEQVTAEPIAVEVEDTVGAGDAFAAGLICAVLEDRPLAQLGKMANAVAGLTCRKRGPLSGQPTRREVERFLAG
jgi:sugar/nucleoside kinase (ribokinase family)